MKIINTVLFAGLVFYQAVLFAQGDNMEQAIAENAEVIARMIADGMDLSVPYPVEYVAVFPTEEAADKVALMFVDDVKSGEKYSNIETMPGEKGGMELLVVKQMLVTAEGIAEFELLLEQRAEQYGGYADGWGVMQE
jgi:regulator of RNase E activity RraB